MMPAKIELQEGDYIGGWNTNLIYIKDVERVTPKERRVLVYDIEYNEYFEVNLGSQDTVKLVTHFKQQEK